MIRVPKYILEQLGDLVGFFSAPVSPVGVLFPYNMPLAQVRESLKLVLRDIDMRMESVEEKVV